MSSRYTKHREIYSCDFCGWEYEHPDDLPELCDNTKDGLCGALFNAGFRKLNLWVRNKDGSLGGGLKCSRCAVTITKVKQGKNKKRTITIEVT